MYVYVPIEILSVLSLFVQNGILISFIFIHAQVKIYFSMTHVLHLPLM